MESKHFLKPLETQINPIQPLWEIETIEVQKPGKRKQPRLHLFGDLINKQPKIKLPELPDPQPLPPRYKDFVLGKGADEKSLKLVLVKRLEDSDTKKQQDRLSFPCGRIQDSFLNPKEEEFLKGSVEARGRNLRNKLEVMVVDPLCNGIRTMKLAKWNDKDVEPGQKNSWWLALTSSWMAVVKANGLQKGDVIQVWSFRVKDKNKLGFIIHKIESGSGSGSGSDTGSDTGSVSGSNATIDDNWLRCSL